MLRDGVRLAIYSDRFKLPAPGIFGGEPGATGGCHVLRGGERVTVRSKDALELRQGDVIVLSLGGGGGYGDKAARPAALIARDVADGIVSSTMAASWA